MPVISPKGLPIFQERLSSPECSQPHHFKGTQERHLRFRVFPVSERVRRALNNKFTPFTKFRKGTVFLDNPEPDTGNCHASTTRLSDLLESGRHGDCGGSLGHTYSGIREKASDKKSGRLTYHIPDLGLHWAEPSQAGWPALGKGVQLH